MIYLALTFVNCTIAFFVYGPKIMKILRGLRYFDAICSKMSDRWTIYTTILVVLTRQWLSGNVTRISSDEYRVSLVLNNELTILNLKKTTPKVVDVQDASTEESYMDIAKSHLSYSILPWKLPQTCIVYYEDGSTASI
jgi:hypothetical protein